MTFILILYLSSSIDLVIGLEFFFHIFVKKNWIMNWSERSINDKKQSGKPPIKSELNKLFAKCVIRMCPSLLY